MAIWSLLVVVLYVAKMCSSVALQCAGETCLYNVDPDELEDSSSDIDSTVEVCMTETCVTTAASLIASIDRSVDPCDDFHQFACGKWMENNVLPEDTSRYGKIHTLIDDEPIKLKILLERTGSEIEPVQKAKDFYQSCLDTDKIEERDLAMMSAFWAEIGTWPVLDDTWSDSSFDLAEQLAHVTKLGAAPIVSMAVLPARDDSTKYIICINEPRFKMLSRFDLLRGRGHPVVQAYEKLIRDIAVHLGADPGSIQGDGEDILAFEIALANIVAAVPDYFPDVMTLSEIVSEYGNQLDWEKFFTSLFGSADVDISIPLTEPIEVFNRNYFRNLTNLLATTDKRTVANYVIWSAVRELAQNLPERFRDSIQEYDEVLGGLSVIEPRWETCVSETTSILGLAVGRGFVDEHFDLETKIEVDEMVENLRSSMKSLVEELEWMDTVTKQLAIEKADAMGTNIGFPTNPDILNNTILQAWYQNFTYTNDMYFENVVGYIREIWKAKFRRLRDDVDTTPLWTSLPSEVNARYSLVQNAIFFPAGILQSFLYDKNQPMSMNYGGIGVVIGHEITHGFDNRGRQFDKDGNRAQWWSDDIIQSFNEQKQCMIDQYGSFVVPEVNMTVNGIKTQGENIADNGGVRQSFRAYRKVIDDRGYEEPMLPGLDFNNNQLFFLNFAQLWCVNTRPERLELNILIDSHPAWRFRVTGPYQNSQDFADAFQCPLGSFMNPQTKCTVW